VVERRGLRGRLPRAALAVLEEGVAGRRPETPAPGDPALARVRTTLLARNRDALDAAAQAAHARGLRAVCVSAGLRGESRLAGRRLAALARAVAPGPRLLLAGGETTVTVTGPGRGGRCQELALAAALEWQGGTAATLLAAGTDGSDGPTGDAGAFADAGSVARGRAAGVDAAACLARNDSNRFFRAEGGVFTTGPTGTNVMDLVFVYVPGAADGGAPG
jgi:hydroxypyruvate reductase